MSEDKTDDTNGGKAGEPQSTDDLKHFLNNDPEDLPTAEARTPEFGPGGDDADRNESDVGRGSEEHNLVADQPLSAQQSEDEVPDEVQQPEDVDEQGDEMQQESDSQGNVSD